jgi:hypothetical protein
MIPAADGGGRALTIAAGLAMRRLRLSSCSTGVLEHCWMPTSAASPMAATLRAAFAGLSGASKVT